ncbi:RDD family protein [Campylobacter sp. RM13119]|uniref:RDD family protein n=1 Tax=Campylobacter californiensis TaxID=1032243 RepID=UPI001472F9C2|nr:MULTISPECIES: RDD family protein [unclassified Campylobacter]MBE3606772.1 RDD family protein [Campylobacter sp. RM13119]MBE3610367.1 RDD family protein [Campylobacter sp. RM12916]
MPKTKAMIAPVYLRFKAFVIDMFIIFMPILYITTYLIMDGKNDFQNSQIAILMCNIAFCLLLSLFFAISAQSPGYRAQGIYLINLATGRKVGFIHAILRYICFAIAGFSVVGLLLCFFRKDRLNLHDILTKSAPVCKKNI